MYKFDKDMAMQRIAKALQVCGLTTEAEADVLERVVDEVELMHREDRQAVVDRQQEGRRKAMERGSRMGMKPMPIPPDFASAYLKFLSREMKAPELAKKYNVSTATVYRWRDALGLPLVGRGRVRLAVPAEFHAVYDEYRMGLIVPAEAAAKLNVSIHVFYAWVHQHGGTRKKALNTLAAAVGGGLR